MKIKTVLLEKIKESLSSVLPVSLIVLLLSLSFCPLPNSVFISFLFGTGFMVVGIGLFTLGVDQSMTPMGEYIGSQMTKSKKIWLICLLSFFVGALITVSEPDLLLLAGYVPSIDTYPFILSVAAGVGVFLVLAILRIIFAVKLRYLLLFSYLFIFALAAFVNPRFWSVAFDAGGVTTGPLSVPLIMAMGVGISSITSDRGESNDSFGLMALCSVGPVMAILVLGLLYRVDSTAYTLPSVADFTDSRGFGMGLLSSLPHHILEVVKGLFPIVIFFFVFQAVTRPLNRKALLRLTVGVTYTFVGIVLFLVGVNRGYFPVGSYLGGFIGASPYRFALIPIGMLFGYFIVAAEPAVHVLEKQVEEVTSGAISKKMLSFALSLGVAVAVGLAMLRVLVGIPVLWFVGFGYAFSLLLSFFVPEIFTSIAFDSGGVASGALSSAFLMPLAIGASVSVGGDIMQDAFGVIALVALLPPITIQILGLVYRMKAKQTVPSVSQVDITDEIIEFSAQIPTEIEKTPVKIGAKEPLPDKKPDTHFPDIIEFDRRW